MPGIVVFSRGEAERRGTRGFRGDLEGLGTGIGRMLDFEVGASVREAEELGYLLGGGRERVWGFRRDRGFPGTQGP